MKKLSCHIEGFTYMIFKKGPRDSSSSKICKLLVVVSCNVFVFVII